MMRLCKKKYCDYKQLPPKEDRIKIVPILFIGNKYYREKHCFEIYRWPCIIIFLANVAIANWATDDDMFILQYEVKNVLDRCQEVFIEDRICDM